MRITRDGPPVLKVRTLPLKELRIFIVSTMLPNEKSYVKVFPLDGCVLTRDVINVFNAASHATKKSSETRVNLFVGRICLAISNACRLHFEAHINLSDALTRGAEVTSGKESVGIGLSFME